MRINHTLLAASGLVLALAVSCVEKPSEDEKTTYREGIELRSTTVGPEASNQWLKVKAEGSWTLTFSAEDSVDGIDWLTIGQNSGEGEKSVVLSYEANGGEYNRSCTIVLTTQKGEYSCDIIQLCETQKPSAQATTLKSDPVPDWLELPAMNQKDLYFITHDQEINSKTERNYSCYYDPEHLLSHWVAYPLNGYFKGSGSRSNAWGTFDPKVPKDKQPNMSGTFKNENGGYSGYDRGHQCPSADRYRYLANVATFYGTNMTPQLAGFNQGIWAKFENSVRSWSNSFDTLYVVTGADIRQSTKYAYDINKKQITVPSGYYKVLLGYKKAGSVANTSSTGGYSSIAFYFEHNNTYDNSTLAIMQQALSVDELEAKLGIDFFPGLSKRTSSADAVEASVDSWWK